MNEVFIISCTKRDNKDFYNETALGRSLFKLKNIYSFNDIIKPIIFTNNSRGLCECYNEGIEKVFKLTDNNEANVVFVHDDVFIEDSFFLEKLERGLKEFDIIGMAGSSKWSLSHPTVWTNTKCEWSGFVPHIIDGEHRMFFYGEHGKKCVVLDGLFISTKLKNFRNTTLRFDERLKFHHYDIDFCLTAKKLNLTMSTAPIWIVHCSRGNWQNDPIWHESEKVMLKKWSKNGE